MWKEYGPIIHKHEQSGINMSNETPTYSLLIFMSDKKKHNTVNIYIDNQWQNSTL